MATKSEVIRTVNEVLEAAGRRPLYGHDADHLIESLETVGLEMDEDEEDEES